MTREEILKVAKPILFNTEMVKAILEGVGEYKKYYKTCTRRLIKPQPRKDAKVEGVVIHSTDKREKGCTVFNNPDGTMTYTKPKYKKGDYLYVRETWDVPYNPKTGYAYRASCKDEAAYLFKWHPSIHMPKEAARIFLRIMQVRVERLKDIDGQGVLKEGVNTLVHPSADYFDTNQREAFAELWNSTIKKEDRDKYGWDANPWVWVYEFERVEVE